MTTPGREEKPLAGASTLRYDSESNGTTLAAALRLASRAVPVLPVYVCRVTSLVAGEVVRRYEKRPLIRNWYLSATTDPDTIAYWFGQHWPNAGLGVVTGYRSGWVVVDVDPRNGGDETQAKLPELPETLTHATTSGGRHYVFRHNDPLPSGVLGPGVDLKADGGFIVVPPTPGYKVVLDAKPADFSSCVIGHTAAQGVGGFDCVQGEASGQTNPSGSPNPLRGRVTTPLVRSVDNPDSYVQAALNYCHSDVSTAHVGSRNFTLYRKALYLAGLVAGGHLAESEIRETLTDAALAAGLGIDEIKATLDSGVSAGMARPIVVEKTRLGGVR